MIMGKPKQIARRTHHFELPSSIKIWVNTVPFLGLSATLIIGALFLIGIVSIPPLSGVLAYSLYAQIPLMLFAAPLGVYLTLRVCAQGTAWGWMNIPSKIEALQADLEFWRMMRGSLEDQGKAPLQNPERIFSVHPALSFLVNTLPLAFGLLATMGMIGVSAGWIVPFTPKLLWMIAPYQMASTPIMAIVLQGAFAVAVGLLIYHLSAMLIRGFAWMCINGVHLPKSMLNDPMIDFFSDGEKLCVQTHGDCSRHLCLVSPEYVQLRQYDDALRVANALDEPDELDVPEMPVGEGVLPVFTGVKRRQSF
jgi:hypothetical protein